MESKKWLSKHCPHLDEPRPNIGLYELCLVMEDYHKHKLTNAPTEKKEIMIWKATIELKWCEAHDTKELEGPCAANGAYWPEFGISYWKLKQKWVSDAGGEEWRLIQNEY